MFITDLNCLLPISKLLGDDIGYSYWNRAEVAVAAIWFLVELRVVEQDKTEPFEFGRTLLVSDIEQVAHFLTPDSPDIFIRAVHIVTPGHVNGSQNWAMEKLVQVWDAHEPASKSQHVTVYETESGKRYCFSLLGNPVEKLTIKKMRFELPCVKFN